jgi:hypothetical protein
VAAVDISHLFLAAQVEAATEEVQPATQGLPIRVVVAAAVLAVEGAKVDLALLL